MVSGFSIIYLFSLLSYWNIFIDVLQDSIVYLEYIEPKNYNSNLPRKTTTEISSVIFKTPYCFCSLSFIFLDNQRCENERFKTFCINEVFS